MQGNSGVKKYNELINLLVCFTVCIKKNGTLRKLISILLKQPIVLV